MAGDTEVHQLAPSVVDDEEDVEYAARGGGDGEEVDRGETLAVVGEKCAPSLPFVGMGRAPGHGARYGALGDLEPELQDLIERAETRSRLLPLKDSDLLSEREVLQYQVGPAGEDRDENPGDGQSVAEHPRTMMAVGREGNRTRPRSLRVSCTAAQLVEGQGGRGCGEAHPFP
jgi:hypothetical protein